MIRYMHKFSIFGSFVRLDNRQSKIDQLKKISERERSIKKQSEIQIWTDMNLNRFTNRKSTSPKAIKDFIIYN